MKRIFASNNVAEVRLLQSLIEEEGMQCVIRNEQIASTSAIGIWSVPELWVSDDDVVRAEQLVSRWQEQPAGEMESWVCSNCGEENEGQFGACWNCEEPIDEDSKSQY